VPTTQSPRTPTKPADLDAPFFTVREVAWLLHCSFNTVRRMLEDGRLAYSQREKGGTILVSREDIEAYHQAHRVGPAAHGRRIARRHRQPARAAA
jgi:excisionase family DNA binding protein